MATEHQLERWAQALVEASVCGDPVVCEKYKVTDRSLRNWRRWLTTMPRLRQLYEAKLSRINAEFSDSLTTRSALVVVRSQRRDARSKGINRQAVRELADAAAAEIVAVAALAGLPEVKSVERCHILPSGRRISLFVAHRDGSYTVCEVLPARAYEHACALGHLLFNFESVRMAYRLPASSIRLCVLADSDAPPLWNRVVASVGVEIGFCNIIEAVRERLSSQAVSTLEPAADAA